MDRDEEPRPRRPGTGGRGDGGHEPEDVVPHEYVAEEDEIDDGGIQGLKAIIGANLFAIEDLWGKIDPRDGQADRLREHIGPCPEMLAAFFAKATSLLQVLEEMLDRLDQVSDPGGTNWQQPSPVPVANLAGFIMRNQDGSLAEVKDRLIAKVIEILGKAGVEVDEADVDSWTREQRETAMRWATAERHVTVPNPYKRPTFLPEA